MARAERLLALIQVLRRHRYPVSGQAIADELGVSLRTVYRDIQTLIGQGAAMRAEHKLILHYANANGERTRRTVWPVALGFFDRARVLVAWCELRAGFRHFRTDRIAKLRVTDKRYPRRRRVLMKEWRAAEG